jgi:hypothetical protein
MKTYWGVEVQRHAFFTSALEAGEWSALRLGRCKPGVRAPETHCVESWVLPRASRKAVEERKIPIPRRESEQKAVYSTLNTASLEKWFHLDA